VMRWQLSLENEFGGNANQQRAPDLSAT